MVDHNFGYTFVLVILCYTKETSGTVESWNLQEQCGRTLQTHGGVLHFDASRFGKLFCEVTLIGLGANDTMLSLFFTSFNIIDDLCVANITLAEPGMQPMYRVANSPKGLYQSFCRNNGYLNENSMYTTTHNKLVIKYSAKKKTSVLKVSIKFTSFTSRLKGCTTNESDDEMFSCPSGRCVHNSLLCEDLNPCGDHRDCNITSASSKDDGAQQGIHYIKLVVITVVVLFSIFALIQITLIIRNDHNQCSLKGRPKKQMHIEAELMPMTNDQTNRKHDDNTIEVLRS